MITALHNLRGECARLGARVFGTHPEHVTLLVTRSYDEETVREYRAEASDGLGREIAECGETEREALELLAASLRGALRRRIDDDMAALLEPEYRSLLCPHPHGDGRTCGRSVAGASEYCAQHTVKQVAA